MLKERLAGELRALGWDEGKDYRFEVGVTGSDPSRQDAVARGFVEKRVDLIVAVGSHMALAAKRATGTIPVVMMLSGNPQAAGIVESLARPGRNITGLRTYVDGIWEKYVELTRELLPGLRTLGVISDYVPPAFTMGEFEYGQREMRRAAKALGVALAEWQVTGDADLERALAEVETARPDALFVTGGSTHAQPRNVARIKAFLQQRKLAMVNDIPGSVFRSAGGVMAYAVSFDEVAVRTASFVDRILKGAKPGELPIEQPAKIELVINAKVARGIGLAVPRSLLLRADRVIE